MINYIEPSQALSEGIRIHKAISRERTMSKYMQLELKRINRRIEKAKRRLKNPKYAESESEVIDRLTLKKLEILGQ